MGWIDAEIALTFPYDIGDGKTFISDMPVGAERHAKNIAEAIEREGE